MPLTSLKNNNQFPKEENFMSTRRLGILVSTVVGLLVLIAVKGQMLETNNAGFYQVKQDAITTSEQGRARVAKAEADALVEKKTAVINAERETEVKKQEKLQAEQQAKADIVQGEAAAQVAKLKVAAGLTPLERATIAKETAIGVAGELAKVKFPNMMIIGGEGKNGNAVNPFDAVGLESFMRLNKEMSNTKTQKEEQ